MGCCYYKFVVVEMLQLHPACGTDAILLQVSHIPRALQTSACAQVVWCARVVRMLAHISGIPVEESALSLGPIALLTGSLTLARLRRFLARAHGGEERP